VKKKDLAKQIQSEKDAQARDELLEDISERDFNLKKTSTVDKSKLPAKEEMKAQITAEKQEQKREGEFNQVLTKIQEGDHHLKKIGDVKEKNLVNLSKEDLIALIKAEREAYKAEEAANRAAVLGDIAEGAKKLKKTTTTDKSKKRKRIYKKKFRMKKKLKPLIMHMKRY